jgi:predicted  nucleic acid-binding Zn-ribbon protein
MIRNAFLKKVEKRLHGLNGEIDSLGRKAASAEAEARALFVSRVETLRSKADAARRRIEAVRTAGAANWGRLKDDVEDAIEDLRKEVDKAIQRFRKTGSDDR